MSDFDTRKYCIDYNIVSGSFILDYDGKKKYRDAPAWNKLTSSNFKNFHKSSHTCLGILTGSINKIIVIDCDIGKSQGQFPQEILDYLENTCKAIVKTPNGKHYYYSTNHTIKKQTGAYWKGNKIEWLDILAEKAHIIAPPSHYLKGDSVVAYKWEKGNLSTIDTLPEEVLQFIKPPKKTNHKEDNIETILDSLTIERWKDYTMWINIGMILKSEGFSCELWDKYSQKAPNYKMFACQEKWRSFPDENDLTISTLYHYLKEDNPEMFEGLKNISGMALQMFLEPTHNSYAKIFYYSNNDKYAFTPEAGWFQLINNIWVNCGKKPLIIKQYISDQLSGSIKDYIEHYNQEEQTEDVKGIIKTLIKGKMNLQTNGFLESIVCMLEEYYLNRDIYHKLDCNRNLLAFNDKVFDFDNKEFRDIQPQDYISITTGYDAPDIDTPFHPELKNFFESIFESLEVTQFVYDILSYTLCGDKNLEKLIFLKGKGGNGKSKLLALLKNILGSYCSDIPITYFTKPDDKKDNTSPSLYRARCQRMLYATEPETKDKLQVSFLNKISGNDLLTVRTLYKEEITFTPQFQSFVCMNDCRLNKVDLAFKRRLSVIRMPFQYRTQEEIDDAGGGEYYKLINTSLGKLFESPEIRNSLMTFLLRNYTKKETIIIPEKIKEYTKEYLDENNPLVEFLSKYYITTNIKEDKIKVGDIFKEYNSTQENKLRTTEFSAYLDTLGITKKPYQGTQYCIGIKKKELEEE